MTEKSARSPTISGHRSKRRPGARLTSRKQPLPQSRVDASRRRGKIESSVLGAVGSYLFPSRTQQSSPPAPKILGTSVPGKIGQGRDLKTPTRKRRGLLFFGSFRDASSGAAVCGRRASRALACERGPGDHAVRPASREDRCRRRASGLGDRHSAPAALLVPARLSAVHVLGWTADDGGRRHTVPWWSAGAAGPCERGALARPRQGSADLPLPSTGGVVHGGSRDRGVLGESRRGRSAGARRGR